VAAGLATAGLEALWYALATGVPASAVLSAPDAVRFCHRFSGTIRITVANTHQAGRTS
jgi:hypothetical protein